MSRGGPVFFKPSRVLQRCAHIIGASAYGLDEKCPSPKECAQTSREGRATHGTQHPVTMAFIYGKKKTFSEFGHLSLRIFVGLHHELESGWICTLGYVHLKTALGSAWADPLVSKIANQTRKTSILGFKSMQNELTYA